jgi:predicted metalloprotease with PDZ domain
MRKIALPCILLTAMPCLGAPVSYEVRIDAEHLRVAHVEAHLTPREGLLHLDRDARDTGLYHGWATFVHELAVVDDEGSPIEVEYLPNGKWRLSRAADSPVTVRYTMLLQHDRFPNDPGDDELAYARDYGVMWTGRALFLEGAPSDDIEVKFLLPEGWQATTPWNPVDGDPRRFHLTSFDELLDSAFMAGTHRVVRLAGDRVHLALGGDMAAYEEALTSEIGGYTEAYSRLFGAAPSRRLLLVLAAADYSGGGVMGSSISMLLQGELDESTAPILSYMTAHEIFHLWNAAWRVGQDDSSALQWLAEGAAEYYTFLTLLRRGDLDRETFLGMVAERCAKYLDAQGELSLVRAGAEKLDHYDLIYSGGMMAVAALDLTVRHETGNRHSFDDVLRYLDSTYSGEGESRLSLRSLPAAIQEATGVDTGQLMQRCIVDDERLPLERLFRYAGLELEIGSDGEGRVASLSEAPDPPALALDIRTSLLGPVREPSGNR